MALLIDRRSVGSDGRAATKAKRRKVKIVSRTNTRAGNDRSQIQQPFSFYEDDPASTGNEAMPRRNTPVKGTKRGNHHLKAKMTPENLFPCFRSCGPISCPKNRLPMPRDLWYRIVYSQALEQQSGNGSSTHPLASAQRRLSSISPANDVEKETAAGSRFSHA